MELEDFTIFDIFIKNNFLYMILSINRDPVTENDLVVQLNNQILTLNHKLVKDLYEPILIFVYDIPIFMVLEVLNITYKNHTYNLKDLNITLKICKPKNKKKLALTTLFKHNLKELFELFYDYYTKQGVEDFYIYYNGSFEELKTLEEPETLNFITSKKNVFLIEWNFRYFNIGEKYKYLHHAQLGQIHDALYKYGKMYYDYMIFCDFDEYLHIPNSTILQLIENNPNIDRFVFNNIWSSTIDNKIPKNSEDLKSIIKWKTINRIHTYPLCIGNNNYIRQTFGRTKNIYKIDDLLLLGIHVDICWKKNPETIEDPGRLQLLHFHKWGGTFNGKLWREISNEEIENNEHVVYNM